MGIILYEFLVGLVPFYGDNVDELFDQITSEDVEPDFPDDPPLPEEAVTLIKCLLVRVAGDRLGAHGVGKIALDACASTPVRLIMPLLWQILHHFYTIVLALQQSQKNCLRLQYHRYLCRLYGHVQMVVYVAEELVMRFNIGDCSISTGVSHVVMPSLTMVYVLAVCVCRRCQVSYLFRAHRLENSAIAEGRICATSGQPGRHQLL